MSWQKIFDKIYPPSKILAFVIPVVIFGYLLRMETTPTLTYHFDFTGQDEKNIIHREQRFNESPIVKSPYGPIILLDRGTTQFNLQLNDIFEEVTFRVKFKPHDNPKILLRGRDKHNNPLDQTLYNAFLEKLITNPEWQYLVRENILILTERDNFKMDAEERRLLEEIKASYTAGNRENKGITKNNEIMGNIFPEKFRDRQDELDFLVAPYKPVVIDEDSGWITNVITIKVPQPYHNRNLTMPFEIIVLNQKQSVWVKDLSVTLRRNPVTLESFTKFLSRLISRSIR